MGTRGSGGVLLVLSAMLLGVSALHGQAPPPEHRDRGHPPRLTATSLAARGSIRVDGQLSEAEWASAEPLTELWQLEPDEGAPASHPTQVRVLFDAERLYIGVQVASEPSGPVARIRERDHLMDTDPAGDLAFAGDDGIAFLLDAARDRRSAVVLATNPLGARFDAQVTNDGRTINVEWDGIWEVGVARVDGGWSAELAVPFSTFRSDDSTWGFNVYRVLSRSNEHALWTSWRRGSEGFLRVSRAGELAGLHRPQAGRLRRLQAKPYTLIRDAASRTAGSLTGTTDLGVDLKAELGPGLVLDATLNPDFATADVDDETVNLTRYDLFLPEKRGFFLENSGIFSFGVRSGGEPPPFEMFHSRRLGIAESGPVRILGGGRLTGRIGSQTVGLLHVATDRNAPVASTSGTVARVKRDVGEAGYVGGMLTHASGRAGRSTTGGLDASLWPSSGLNVQAFWVRSGATGSRGDAAYSAAIHYDSEWVGFDGEYTSIGPNTRADLGFMARADVHRAKALLRVTLRPPLSGVRRMDLNLLGSRFGTSEGALTDREFGPALAVHSDAGDLISAYTTVGRTQLHSAFTLAQRIPVPVGSYSNRLRGLVLATSAARALSASVQTADQLTFGGRIATTDVAAHASLLGRLIIESGLTLSSAKLPGGRFEAHVPRLGLRYALSNRLVSAVRAQRNSLDGDQLIRLRIEYLYRPGSEIFLVFQTGRSLVDGLVQRNHEGIVKVTWLHQF